MGQYPLAIKVCNPAIRAMGVPGGRAVYLTPSGRPAWQPLDSPLWQASRDEGHEAAWEEFGPGPSNPLLGSDGFTRLRTPGALSSRPRSAGSTMASLEAARAAGEAARAAADAALAAAQLIVQDMPGLEPAEPAEPAQPRSRSPSERKDVPSGTEVAGAQRERSRARSVEMRPASLLDGFLRSLVTSQDMSALDRRMEMAQSKPPVGVEAPGRWQHAPGEQKAPATTTEEKTETLTSLEDFLSGLQRATQHFDAAVGASPSPSPPRPAAARQPLEEYCVVAAEPLAPVASPVDPVPSANGRPPSRSRRHGAPTTSNLAAMAAYVKEAPPVAPPAAPTAPRRPPAVAAPQAATGVKLPPLPQKTREALEAAAMQPMYVKEAFKLLSKPLKRLRGAEELATKALPSLRSASMPSLVSRRPTSDRGKREVAKAGDDFGLRLLFCCSNVEIVL
eukprot:s1129_g16.t1